MSKELRDGIVRSLVLSLIIFVCVIAAYSFDVNETQQQRRFLHNNIIRTDERGLISNYVQPFQVDDDGTNTFIRFESGTNLVFIKKISIAGNITTFEGAITNWAARTNATYVPIND